MYSYLICLALAIYGAMTDHLLMAGVLFIAAVLLCILEEIKKFRKDQMAALHWIEQLLMEIRNGS